MFSISAGIKQIIDMLHKLSSNKYESASKNHIDYSEFQGCLLSSKKQLDNKWYSGYKSVNSEFISERSNKLDPGPIVKFVIDNKLTSKAFSVAKEINILNTVLINHYGVLDISRKSLEAEFDKYRESGFNFSEQRAKIIEKKNIQLIESRNLDLSNTGNILADLPVLNYGSWDMNNENIQIKSSVKKLAISGYISRYSGVQGLRASLEDIIIKKEACIDALKSIFDINNGLSCDNDGESESVALVGIKDKTTSTNNNQVTTDITLNIQDSSSRTPLRLAKNLDYLEIVKVLESFTSDYNQNPDINNNIPISDITKGTASLTNHVIDPINGLSYCADVGSECITILGEQL